MPMGEAVLCQSCGTVNNTRGYRCDVCGSLGLVNLARLLNRTANNETIEAEYRELMRERMPAK